MYNNLKRNLTHIFQITAYGMTESSPVLTIPPLSCTEKATIGPPISRTQAKVVDINTGQTLPQGQTGELCFKGPQVGVI